jgi:NitT/TauT family transport system permease protein
MWRAALVGQLVFVCVLLMGWEAASRLRWVDPSLLPPFSLVVVTLWGFLGDPSFLADLQVTCLEVLVAFALAAPLAISTGLLLGEKLRWGRVVNPMIHFVLAVPQSIFLPIFILTFGIGFLEKVVFGATHAYFIMVVNTVAAVRAVPAPLVLAARSFGASPVQIYTRIHLPAMLPLVVTGLRYGMIFNIIGVILAEMYASRQGIGRLISFWGEAFKMPELLAGILLISGATIVLNEMMRLWEARFERWRSAAAGS